MRLVFAGTPEVAASALRKLANRHDIALVITRPDAPIGRKKIITASPVALEAESLELPTLKTARIGEVELAQIESAGADLGVVVAYGSLLTKTALEHLEWWNLHFSLLPSWRGATPLQHSIWHAQGQGISVFKLDAGMDTGDILGSLPLTHPEDCTAGELLPQLADQGSDLILELLESQPQPRSQTGTPSFAPKLTRKEARLDFGATAELNARKVMALNPEPMAWAEFRDEPIRVLRAKAIGNVDWSSLDETDSPIGSVQQSGESVLVTCGEGTRLQLIEVQPGGKRVMTGLEWFRGLQGSVVLD